MPATAIPKARAAALPHELDGEQRSGETRGADRRGAPDDHISRAFLIAQEVADGRWEGYVPHTCIHTPRAARWQARAALGHGALDESQQGIPFLK
jgi:hypothetical protein